MYEGKWVNLSIGSVERLNERVLFGQVEGDLGHEPLKDDCGVKVW